ncbi:MAG: hypothetical protein E6Q58_03080 [Niabella sp.]|nr:MAG: hypothetical protein E6Q58_03080 [Niabella sp.]
MKKYYKWVMLALIISLYNIDSMTTTFTIGYVKNACQNLMQQQLVQMSSWGVFEKIENLFI